MYLNGSLLSVWRSQGSVGRGFEVGRGLQSAVVLAASGSESEASPEKRSKPDDAAVAEETRGGAKQRSRRRCHRCQTKLELVQQELGPCRCGQCGA